MAAEVSSYTPPPPPSSVGTLPQVSVRSLKDSVGNQSYTKLRMDAWTNYLLFGIAFFYYWLTSFNLFLP